MPVADFFISYCSKRMHEVVPSVVAMAVSIVIANCSIFCQSSLFMGGRVLEL